MEIKKEYLRLFNALKKKTAKLPNIAPFFPRKLPIYRILFKSKDEKRIIGIMNFQKNLEMEMKKEYL